MQHQWKAQIRVDVLEALTMYIPILENMPSVLRDSLLNALKEMDSLGAHTFGYRTIDKEGNSAVFSTNRFWYLYFTNESVLTMRTHMNSELPNLVNAGYSLLTRSLDKSSTPYLKLLNTYKLNNSVIKHKLDKSGIKIFYFIVDYYKPQDRDRVISNLPKLEMIIKTIQSSLDYIVNSQIFHNTKQNIINYDILDNIYRSITYRNINGIEFYNSYGSVILSHREVEVLSLFNIGVNNNSIAQKLGISKFTVKRHLENIKVKLGVSSYQEVIKIINKTRINLKEILLEVI